MQQKKTIKLPNGKEIEIDFTENEEEQISLIKSHLNNSEDELSFIAVVLSIFLLFSTFIAAASANNYLIIFWGMLIVFTVLGLIFNYRKKEIKKYEIVKKIIYSREFLFQKEINQTEIQLEKERESLEKIKKELINLEQVYQDNQTSFLTDSTKKRYTESLNHLQLQQELKIAKIDFFEAYLKKWKIKAAIERAESLLLNESETSTQLALPQKVEEDILQLRPLAERMDLCENEVEARDLLKELRTLEI